MAPFDQSSDIKIKVVRTHVLRVPLDRVYWWSTESYNAVSRIIVEVETDNGLIGIGQIQGRPVDVICDVVAGFGDMISGMDALGHMAVYQKLFAVTMSRAQATLNARDEGQPHFGPGTRPQIMAAIAGIDIALWDIKGKALGLPVWKLLGGENRPIYAYASGGYYEEGADPFTVVEECAGYIDSGYDAVKIKIAGMDLKTDLERVKRVREVLGPDTRIMIDANCAYSLQEATEAIRAYDVHDIFWFEEPIHWYDHYRGGGRLSLQTHVPLAGGESQLDRWSIRDLIDWGGVSYIQFDATRSGGVTAFLQMSAYASMHGVQVVPHHEPQIHGHLILGIDNGFGVESFPNPKRDPLWDTLYDERPQLSDGMLHLDDRPGFGCDINWDTVERFRI